MKKQLSITARRSIIATLLFPLWGLGGFGSGLSAQVSVSNMATTYTANNNKISFTITWTTQPHNNQIWVITDYIKVAGTAPTGSWSRATVTAVTKNSGTGSASTVSGNRGFWLNTSGSSGSANVTATLSLAAGVDKFNWCAYALNKAPNATFKTGGGYELHGTKPFRITYNNGSSTTTDETTFNAGCITAITDATDNPAGFFPILPTASVNSPSRCGTGNVTLTATASGGTTSSMSYTWKVGTASETTTTTNTYSPSVAVGSTTYSVKITNSAGCTNTSNVGTVTARATPTITLASGSTAQTVTNGTAISPIKYNTANATGASISGTPTGISGSWASNVYTISGSPTAGGTFNYTVTTTNSNGCTNVTATGKITVNSAITYTGCTTPSITLGTVGFTSTTNYSLNGLTISSPVTATYCNNRTYTSFNGGSSGAYKADCSTNYYGASKGNWFSWCMVKQYAAQLCPSPWRVPTLEDHCQIVKNTTANCPSSGSTLNGVAGYEYTYCVIGGGLESASRGIYWSSTENNTDRAYNLYFDSSTAWPQSWTGSGSQKSYGFVLRCVR